MIELDKKYDQNDTRSTTVTTSLTEKMSKCLHGVLILYALFENKLMLSPALGSLHKNVRGKKQN